MSKWVMEKEMQTSPTGGTKERKDCELGYVDPAALEALGRVAGMGARKYSPWNYMNGYNWSWSYNAMLRHMIAFWSGEDNDPESGLPHMAHAAWHALALTSFLLHSLGEDDRVALVRQCGHDTYGGE